MSKSIQSNESGDSNGFKFAKEPSEELKGRVTDWHNFCLVALELLTNREMSVHYGLQRLRQDRPGLAKRLSKASLQEYYEIPSLILNIYIGPQLLVEERLAQNLHLHTSEWTSGGHTRVARIPGNVEIRFSNRQ